MDLALSTEIDETEYGRFLDGFTSHPRAALAYHYPFYLRFLADRAYPGSTLRFVAARDSRGGLAGVVPAINVRTAHLNLWLSLAYFGPNAGALVPSADRPEGVVLVRELVRAAVRDARDRGCGSMTMYTPLDAPPDPYREGFGGQTFEIARTSQWLEIDPDEQVAPWPRKVRYDIRRADSLGVRVREMGDESDLAAVWEIYHAQCLANGTPVKPNAHVLALYRSAGDHGVFLVAEHEGRIVAGLVALIGGGVLSYYLPCARPEARPLQPGLRLLDAAVTIGRRRGCRLLNFEASPGTDSSVHRFKARCGGQPVRYHTFVKLLREDAFETYRALTSEGLAREAPHAFVIPFDALAGSSHS